MNISAASLEEQHEKIGQLLTKSTMKLSKIDTFGSSLIIQEAMIGVKYD